MKIYPKYVSILVLTLLVTTSTFSLLVQTYAQDQTPKTFFTLSLICPQGNKVREQVGVVLKEELAKIGIGVNLEYKDFATLLKNMEVGGSTGATADQSGFDMFLMGDSPDSTDPSGLTSWFDSKYVYPDGNNVWRYFDPQLDKLLEQADAMFDRQARLPLYQQALQIVKDKAFSIELYYPASYAAKQKVVQNCTYWAGVGAYGTYEARFWTLAGKTAGADDTKAIYAMPTDIKSLIETLSELTYDTNVHYLMYDALIMHPFTELDPNYGKFMPALAKSWDVSEDQMTYTFHLRTDVKWHDGVPFTSKDVKFTYDAIMDPETAAADAQYWRENVASVSAPDDYTVVVQMKQPMHAVYELVFRRMIMPEHILGSIAHKDWMTSPYNTGEKILPGTGPYQLVSWKKDESFEFVANPNYFMGAPFIKHLFIKIIPDTTVGLAALEKNEIQLVDQNYGVATEYNRLTQNKDLNITFPEPIYAQQLHINCQHPILSNLLVRQAISYAIPREHICTDLALGQAIPATQWIAPGRSWAYDPNLQMTPYDITKARSLMEQAGYKFSYLEPQTTPLTAFLLPAGGSLVVGLVVGAGAIYLMNRSRKRQD